MSLLVRKYFFVANFGGRRWVVITRVIRNDGGKSTRLLWQHPSQIQFSETLHQSKQWCSLLLEVYNAINIHQPSSWGYSTPLAVDWFVLHSYSYGTQLFLLLCQHYALMPIKVGDPHSTLIEGILRSIRSSSHGRCCFYLCDNERPSFAWDCLVKLFRFLANQENPSVGVLKPIASMYVTTKVW
jgi:hypothetical protein